MRSHTLNDLSTFMKQARILKNEAERLLYGGSNDRDNHTKSVQDIERKLAKLWGGDD